jgi:hypothetical protein
MIGVSPTENIMVVSASSRRGLIGLAVSAILALPGATLSPSLGGGLDSVASRQGSDAELDAALTEAADPHSNLAEILPKVWSRFQTVDACTRPGRNMWSIRTLNRRGKKIDAITFTVPPGPPLHLYWAFSVPHLTTWYILPRTGTLEGFTQFFPTRDTKFRLPSMDGRLIFQDLTTRLEGGKDYMIYFTFDTDQAVTLAASIALLNDDLPGKGKNIEAALGIEKITGPERAPAKYGE